MKSFLGIRTALVGACIASLIGLFVGQSMATAEPIPSHPTARVAERTQSAPTAPPPVPPKVAWPDNGIAQRRLEGGFNYNMFVENDNGTWRAWVQSDMNDPERKSWAKAKALDFFSGKEQMVRASVDDLSFQQTPGFVDSKGKYHGPEDRRFSFNNRGELIGLHDGEQLRQGESLSLHGERCSASFIGVRGGLSRGWTFYSSWTKIPLIYERALGSLCPESQFESGFDSTLDLGDGTFLATMGCWVFRLRKADLSPAGEAPALRIVDEAAMKAAIDKAKGQHIEDATAYLVQALGLELDDANTCITR